MAEDLVTGRHFSMTRNTLTSDQTFDQTFDRTFGRAVRKSSRDSPRLEGAGGEVGMGGSQSNWDVSEFCVSLQKLACNARESPSRAAEVAAKTTLLLSTKC